MPISFAQISWELKALRLLKDIVLKLCLCLQNTHLFRTEDFSYKANRRYVTTLDWGSSENINYINFWEIFFIYIFYLIF